MAIYPHIADAFRKTILQPQFRIEFGSGFSTYKPVGLAIAGFNQVVVGLSLKNLFSLKPGLHPEDIRDIFQMCSDFHSLPLPFAYSTPQTTQTVRRSSPYHLLQGFIETNLNQT